MTAGLLDMILSVAVLVSPLPMFWRARRLMDLWRGWLGLSLRRVRPIAPSKWNETIGYYQCTHCRKQCRASLWEAKWKFRLFKRRS